MDQAEESTTAELSVPVDESSNYDSVSPSPAASPLHNSSQQAGVAEDTVPIEPSLGANTQGERTSPLRQVSAQKGRSSSQVRTTDDIERDYIYVYSDGEIKCLVCIVWNR